MPAAYNAQKVEVKASKYLCEIYKYCTTQQGSSNSSSSSRLMHKCVFNERCDTHTSLLISIVTAYRNRRARFLKHKQKKVVPNVNVENFTYRTVKISVQTFIFTSKFENKS